jgi:hypothetical protein
MREYKFSDLLNSIISCGEYIFYFNRDIEFYKAEIKNLSIEAHPVNVKKNYFSFSYQKNNNTTERNRINQLEEIKNNLYKLIGRTRYELLKFNALAKAFTGQYIIIENLSFENPFRLDPIDFIASLPLNKNAFEVLKKDKVLREFAEKRDLMKGDDIEYLQIPRFDGSYDLKTLIKVRNSIYVAFREAGHLMNTKQLLLSATEEKFGRPAVNNLDYYIECFISKKELGKGFSKETLLKDFEYPSDNYVTEFKQKNVDSDTLVPF